VWAQQSTAMFAASAVLGPLCDGCHSRHDILHYAEQPGKILLPALTGAVGSAPPMLETCWWVPVLFGVAGIILGVSHPYLDVAVSQQRFGQERRPAPGWVSTLLVVACFCACYELSGSLAQAEALRGNADHLLTVDAPLFAFAAAILAAFERTAGGAFMAALTAVAGPVVEIGLINGFHLYTYSVPDFWGIPSWIPWVYAAGAPAVGALGRQCLSVLEEQDRAEQRGGKASGT
jgi:hypothetical protein